MRGKSLIRALLATISVAFPLTVVVSQASPAAADTLCHALSYTPGWNTGSVDAPYEVRGAAETTCGMKYTVLTAVATLQGTDGYSWYTKGTGSQAEENTSYAWAFAYFDCYGTGPIYFRTEAQATGTMPPAWTSGDSQYSYPLFFDCPYRPSAGPIKPGG